jgi:GWxTD domain-containing protein
MLLKPYSKDTHSAPSWFYFENAVKGTLPDNCNDASEPVRIISMNPDIEDIPVKAYFRNFPAAIPPFVLEKRKDFDYKPDSSFTVRLTKGVSGSMFVRRQGLYFFQPDTSLNQGPTLFSVYPGYPKINTPEQMLGPLRYITSAKEYNQLAESNNIKVAIDSFWVSTAGGIDRAVELIRNYYGRVEEANRLFHSFCEGWKTDRGIIYIAFGQPNVVYRSDWQEVWIYGEANNYRSVQFIFDKALNPFSDNDYVLERQSMYKDFWYNAIQRWRR